MNMFYWSTQRVIRYGLSWILTLIRDASTPSWGSFLIVRGYRRYIYSIDPLQNRTALEGRLNNTKQN